MASSAPRAVIFGLASTELSAEERRFFAKEQPLGFILFARNCATPGQIRRLVEVLRACVGRPDAPVLIDQEGGRVQRLKPPHWRAAPSARAFGRLAEIDEGDGIEAVWLNARLIAADLHELGITVDCAPVVDIPQPGAHDIIGDRAFAADPATVALLARGAADGFLAGGVLPVIKHIPGHGRALADSHLELPVVEASRDELDRCDFAPFATLRAMPWAMTAHVVFTAIDPDQPATTSRTMIDGVIRKHLGFDGVLVSDDLCMKALAGTPAERTRAALAAGCDVVLHCNGDLAEMRAIAAACPPLTGSAATRLASAEAMRKPPEPFDTVAGLARLNAILAKANVLA